VEGGYRFATVYGGLTPYAAIQAQSFHTPSYNETDLTGGGFALAFNSRSATDTRSELGTRFDRLLLLNPGAALTMRARVARAHDWVSDPSLVPLFQTLPGASFIVNGATPAKNSALTSAGAELRFANGVTLLAKFDGLHPTPPPTPAPASCDMRGSGFRVATKPYGVVAVAPSRWIGTKARTTVRPAAESISSRPPI
jgi:outer membrane autotransporter protein